VITSLRLENWKSHSKSSFTFGKGTNILLGRMGSGKSSVLDALCFALYGTFPKMSRRDQAVDNLVSLGSASPHATVALEFEKGGKKYLLERKVGRKISDAEVRSDGRLVLKGPKAVSDYVTGILGVDYELFTRAIYSEQNRIDYLLQLNPRQRKGEIDWLLGLGEFDTAREAAQAAATKLSEQSELFASEAAPEKIAEAEKRSEGLSRQQEERKSLVEKLKVEKTDLEAKLKKSEAVAAEQEKARALHNDANLRLQKVSGAAERLKKECEGKNKPGKEEDGGRVEERKKAESDLASQRDALRKLQAGLSSAKSSLAVNENKLKNAQDSDKRKMELSARLKQATGGKMAETLEKELAEERSELEAMVTLHAALHAQEEELQKSIDALSSAGAKCPVCESDLTGGKAEALSSEKRSKIEEGRQLAKKHIAELAEKRARVAFLEKNLVESKSIESELMLLSKSSQDIGALEQFISQSGAQAQDLESQLSLSEKAIPPLEEKVESARKAHEESVRLSKLFSDYEAAEAMLLSAKQALSEITFDEKEYQRSRAATNNLRVEFTRAHTSLSGEEKQLALIGEMLALEKETLGSLRQKAELARKYTAAAESMAIYKNSLIAAQSEMRFTLIEEINDALSEVWPSVYPYSDYGGVKIEADEKDYRLLMEKQGWLEVDAVASGGERACLCLALRIAFATVLTPDVSWLILDEPTHNLDSEAVQMLSEAINEKIPSIVEQTFVITHDPLLGEAGEGMVFRLERDKSKNESTKVVSA